MKAYQIDEKTVLPPYPQTATKTPDAAIVGLGNSYVVKERHNPNATVLVKTALHPRLTQDVMATGALLNEIALKLSQPEAAAVRGHLAVEVLKELTDIGLAVFYTPKVTGFPLDKYFADPQAYRDVLAPAQLMEELDRLAGAMKWLHDEGYAHNDAHAGNIMFDTANRRLVLIDFEKARATKDTQRQRKDFERLDTRVASKARALALQAEAESGALPLYVNPKLSTEKTAAAKTYRIDGQAVLPPYAPSTAATVKGPKSEVEVVGAGNYNKVMARRNPAASVLIKRSHVPREIDSMQQTAATLNAISLRLAQPDAAGLRHHLAPEVLKEVTHEGHAVYYTRKITGFSLDQYFAHPQAYRDALSYQQLEKEIARLRTALGWLNEQGFAHGDVVPRNIMFDTQNHHLVLIDFELARGLGTDEMPCRDDEHLQERVATKAALLRLGELRLA